MDEYAHQKRNPAAIIFAYLSFIYSKEAPFSEDSPHPIPPPKKEYIEVAPKKIANKIRRVKNKGYHINTIDLIMFPAKILYKDAYK